jgi:1,6-anhydro-N-acetylmuramate kinase
MSGTSLDGVDVALIRIEGTGLAMRGEILAGAGRDLHPMDGFDVLRGLAGGVAYSAAAIANASLRFSHEHVEAIREVLAHAGVEKPDLISIHGQTVFHAPPASWQLLNPNPVARAFGVPVVFDLRGADLARGGQGAPITPLADWVLFRQARASVAVVNLGGFCNFTWLPRDQGDTSALDRIAARDVCACNHVMDSVARRALRERFDHAGLSAEKGTPHPTAVAELERVLSAQSAERRSLGTGDEANGWISAWLERLSPFDLARSAAEGVARVIAGAIPKSDRVLLAGGGSRHRVLAERIYQLAGAQPDSGGASMASYREAMCMAVLGALCQDRVPITLPQVTGVTAPAPVAGCWAYP